MSGGTTGPFFLLGAPPAARGLFIPLLMAGGTYALLLGLSGCGSGSGTGSGAEGKKVEERERQRKSEGREEKEKQIERRGQGGRNGGRDK